MLRRDTPRLKAAGAPPSTPGGGDIEGSSHELADFLGPRVGVFTGSDEDFTQTGVVNSLSAQPDAKGGHERGLLKAGSLRFHRRNATAAAIGRNDEVAGIARRGREFDQDQGAMTGREGRGHGGSATGRCKDADATTTRARCRAESPGHAAGLVGFVGDLDTDQASRSGPQRGHRDTSDSQAGKGLGLFFRRQREGIGEFFNSHGLLRRKLILLLNPAAHPIVTGASDDERQVEVRRAMQRGDRRQLGRLREFDLGKVGQVSIGRSIRIVDVAGT